MLKFVNWKNGAVILVLFLVIAYFIFNQLPPEVRSVKVSGTKNCGEEKDSIFPVVKLNFNSKMRECFNKAAESCEPAMMYIKQAMVPVDYGNYYSESWVLIDDVCQIHLISKSKYLSEYEHLECEDVEMSFTSEGKNYFNLTGCEHVSEYDLGWGRGTSQISLY